MRRVFVAVAVTAILMAGALPALAQHGHTMKIGSDVDGSGQMLLDWDFEGMPIARTSDSGFAGLFTGDVPGWTTATDVPPDIYQLDAGTIVEVEVTAIEAGVSIGVTSVVPPSSNTLDSVGDVAIINTAPSLHNHPDFRVVTADANTFGEGSISFKIQENAGSSVGYTESEIVTLKISNGFLPPELLTTADHLKCQTAVAKQVSKFFAKNLTLFRDCLDKILKSSVLAKPDTAAVKACSIDELNTKSIVSKVAAAKAKAVAAIEKKCGILSASSTPYTLSNIQTHLGMTECRAQELTGATYNHATSLIGELLETHALGDHHDVQHEFPCMKASIE